MATTATKKQLQELYIYAKLASAVYSANGDLVILTMTAATTSSNVVGTEGALAYPAGGKTVYVIALTKVLAATQVKVGVNVADKVTFVAGDPRGTMKSVVLTAAASSQTTLHVAGTAGEIFVVMQDPEITSANTAQLYAQSKSGTPAGLTQKLVYDTHGIFRGKKHLGQSEEPQVSFTQLYQASDKGLSDFRGHRFNILCERDENRAGTISEQEYYFGCYDPNFAPSEQAGDNDSDVSVTLNYTFKGVLIP